MPLQQVAFRIPVEAASAILRLQSKRLGLLLNNLLW
ncbi:hypothetical protein ACP70R_049690 [Stipagrostis hirtigluma subsp. patula]